MIVVGIDPGVTGAISFIGRNTVKVVDLPTVPVPGNGTVKKRVHGPGLYDILLANCPADEPCIELIENVAMSMGGQGSSSQTQGSQMQTFGTIQCCVELLGVQPTLIGAKKWKSFFGLDSDKKKSIECARRLWPELAKSDLKLAKSHNRAESLLIAQFGLRNLT
jgi:hypothetical protein